MSFTVTRSTCRLDCSCFHKQMMNALIWILQMKIKVEKWALSDCRDEPKLVSHDSVQTTDLAII